MRCGYCYYLPHRKPGEPGLPNDLLEIYIRKHIEASSDETIRFSWHGGEPLLYGLAGFQKIVSFQKKYRPAERRIINGIQTNGLNLDDKWCAFFAEEGFFVGLSLDGPRRHHDCNRVTAAGAPTHDRVMENLARLKRHGVAVECLCVVHAENARQPVEVYEFFRSLDISWLTFLPLVEFLPDGSGGERSVSGKDWGEFLCAVFDIWRDRDIGAVQVQIFEETARSAFGSQRSSCVLRKTCGNVPTLDNRGDLYCCDRFIAPEYFLGNIRELTLAEMLNSERLKSFGLAKFRRLPAKCLNCPVFDLCGGGCPGDRVLRSEYGEPGLNFLCAGYKRFFLHTRPFIHALTEAWINAGAVREPPLRF